MTGRHIIYHIMDDFPEINLDSVISGYTNGLNEVSFNWFKNKYRCTKFNFISSRTTAVTSNNKDFLFHILDNIDMDTKNMSLIYWRIFSSNNKNYDYITQITAYFINKFCRSISFDTFLKNADYFMGCFGSLDKYIVEYLILKGYVIVPKDVNDILCENNIDVLIYLHELGLLKDHVTRVVNEKWNLWSINKKHSNGYLIIIKSQLQIQC